MGKFDDIQKSSSGSNAESIFVYVLVGVAVVSLLLACIVYNANFVDGFSGSTTRWSEFGGYFSGVLLPIISLLTLIAILRTIFLQREMIKLQNVTFVAQLEQAKTLALDSYQTKVDARKTMLLDSLDRTINTCIRDVERLTSTRVETLRLIVSIEGGGLAVDEEITNAINKLQKSIAIIEGRKNQLEALSYRITVGVQSSVDELQGEFQSGMSKIYAELMTDS